MAKVRNFWISTKHPELKLPASYKTDDKNHNPIKCSVSLMIFKFYHDKLGQPVSEFGVEQQQDALIQSSKSKEILTKDRFN